MRKKKIVSWIKFGINTKSNKKMGKNVENCYQILIKNYSKSEYFTGKS